MAAELHNEKASDLAKATRLELDEIINQKWLDEMQNPESLYRALLDALDSPPEYSLGAAYVFTEHYASHPDLKDQDAVAILRDLKCESDRMMYLQKAQDKQVKASDLSGEDAFKILRADFPE
jgi:hypothetical protein